MTTPAPPRATPEEAFASARDAIARRDWHAAFACLSRTDLLAVVRNGLTMILFAGTPSDALRAACAEAGVPLDDLLRLADERDHAAFRATLDAASKGTKDLDRLAAEVETTMRAPGGGGSVSTRLFQGEELRDLVVDGPKAWADRYDDRGLVDPVAFERKGGAWRVKLRGKRPKGR